MRLHQTNERRGVILLVVLSLLTLFAIVGITFVLYSDSEAAAARVAREAETAQRADVDPEQALAFFLGQFIYDVDDNDVTGVGSGLRGHSLARTMYGYNYAAPGVPGINLVPYSGVGRLHYGSQFGQDDYTLVNYTWFAGDGFIRDPERYGTRTSPTVGQPNSYVGGNAPYTYPDLNNFYLAAVNAYGQVLTPSYHRKWLFNPNNAFNDMTNLNWTNAQGKYLTPRPRPAEHPLFPIPDDAFGDVKNLLWTEGPNDSIWIDVGAPVMTAPDGTQYKMLFAPLIVDLDGRINLNTAGNILGPNNTHVSNQGWGPWEVNLAKVLYADQTAMQPPIEYINLFIGNNLGASQIFGRYGANGVPSTAGAFAPSGTSPHFYAPVDFNGQNEAAVPSPGSAPSSRPLPPGSPANPATSNPNPNPATSAFAMFQQGYLNGGTAGPNGAENTNHPLLYSIFRPAVFNGTDDRVFRALDMEPLLRPNNNLSQPFNMRTPDSGSSALLSDLLRLCPTNLGASNNNPRFRNLVTTLSMELGSPGVTPYWYSIGGVNSYPYPGAGGTATTAPWSSPSQFPTITPGQPLPSITNNPGAMPPNPSDFGADWRALSAALGRIKMNRTLPPYPHMGSGFVPPYGAPLVPFGTSYNLGNANIANQYNAALSARQSLASDIYNRLVSLTGVAPLALPAVLPDPALPPRRWLAQLAVNIVDFIDEDDISTPFLFAAPGGSTAIGATQPPPPNDDPGANPSNQSGNNATGANPTYWVFGTELPKVVLNEALAEAENTTITLTSMIQNPAEQVKVWVELYNTMQTPPGPPSMAQQQDGMPVPLYFTLGGSGYSPYRLTVAQNLMPNPPLSDAGANVLGKANLTAPFPVSTTDVDFIPANVKTIAGGAAPGGATIATQQYFLVGPKTIDANYYQDPFLGAPNTTPVVRTDSLSYNPTWVTGVMTDERTTGLAILLRRLTNPYLPFSPNPSIPDPMNPGNFIPNPVYNPYMTVDYIQNVPVQSNAVPLPTPVTAKATPPTPLPSYASRGKCQPYASLTQVPSAGGVPQAPSGSNAQAGSPVVNQGPPNAIVTPGPANGVTHTFGIVAGNTPLPPSGHYDWLVQLDRPLISPIELLHVSGYQPYQLTQQFMQGSDTVATNMFQHYVPWLDTPPAAIASMSCPWWYDPNMTAGQTHRLYRLFEFLECGDRAFGIDGNGRIPGRVNINTIWDAEILQALIDANMSMGLNAMPSSRPANPADPTAQIFFNLMQSRSPTFVQYNPGSGLCNGAPGPVNMTNTGNDDRPFLPLSTGASPAGQQYTNGVGVATDTLLRLSPVANTQLLLQNPADSNTVHPYLQTQLLAKLYNNVTTRSHAFAVFLTVGFFQVIPGGAVGQSNVPQLGPEIGRSEGRQVRHRMFAIVDRTNLSTFTFPANTAIPAPSTSTTTSGTLTLGPSLPAPAPPPVGWVVSGAGATFTWPKPTPRTISIQPGTQLVVEPGTANEEVVIVQSVAVNANQQAQVTANFSKQHPNPAVTGNTNSFYYVIQRGNPGPQPAYDPRQDPYVVPYYSLID